MADTIGEIIEQIKNQKDVFYKAKLLQHLRKEKGITIKEISDKLGIQSSYICHYLRLNRLPEIVVDGYYTKTISVSHLFIISRLKEPMKMIDAYEKILQENLSVLDTEMLIREILYGIKTTGKFLSKSITEKINSTLLANNNPVTVKIIQSRIKSKLIIEIKDNLSKATPLINNLLNKVSEVLTSGIETSDKRS